MSQKKETHGIRRSGTGRLSTKWWSTTLSNVEGESILRNANEREIEYLLKNKLCTEIQYVENLFRTFKK